MEDLAGRVFGGRWHLQSLLGEGAMGRVYLAQDANLNRQVAVKVIHPRHLNSRTAIPRFLRETGILATLQHPNIVRMIDSGVGEDGNLLYLVMECLHGQTLAEFLRTGQRLRLLEVLSLAEQILLALADVHRCGIIHRDLKPGNVFLSQSPEQGLHVTVFDFGIAFQDDEDRGRLTAEGVIQGTPDYISPEQIDDAACTPQTDFYSLGIILYELLSGELPFVGELPMHIFLQKLHQSAPPLINRWRMDSPPISDLTVLIDRMITRDAAHRPRNAMEILRVLREQRAWLQTEGFRRRPRSYSTDPSWLAAIDDDEYKTVEMRRARETKPTINLDMDERAKLRLRELASHTETLNEE